MSGWVHREANAKVNLALVVGPRGGGGKHEVATVMQRVELADDVAVRMADAVDVEGYTEDTIVRSALSEIAALTGVSFAARIDKRIPVAAGLGGGSSDAAAALRLANGILDEPLPFDELHGIAARLGSDVPFFLRDGPCVGRGDGSDLTPVALPMDYVVLLVMPHQTTKVSTADVYRRFDTRRGEVGFAERRARLELLLRTVSAPPDLASLPHNDLAASDVAESLRELGAFRADVSGAGPAVYGLFADDDQARRAASELVHQGRVWTTRPVP